MKNEITLANYQKKEELIKKYYAKLNDLKAQRNKLNESVKNLQNTFSDLIDADPSQLSMFEGEI